MYIRHGKIMITGMDAKTLNVFASRDLLKILLNLMLDRFY